MHQRLVFATSLLPVLALIWPAAAQPASGIETKLFRATSEVANHPHAEVSVPAGYKVIGCGARVNWHGAGNLLTALYPSDRNSCVADAKDHDIVSPATIDIWAIALHDPDERWEIQVFRENSALANHPQQAVSVPPGWVMTGGGAQDSYSGAGSLLTASYPKSADTWEARGKDHAHIDPAMLTAFAIGIRPKAPGAPVPHTQLFSATGQPTNHPEQTVQLGPGFTLASGGALDDFTGAGSLLTASYPTPDANGWSAAAKDHEYPDPAALTVWAIGIAAGK
jgi:hypothetical protein